MDTFIYMLQVPYSRAKAMTDFALSHLNSLSVSIACLGLLYSRTDGLIGQDRSDEAGVLNLIDLSLLPLTPIMVRRLMHCMRCYDLMHHLVLYRAMDQHRCSRKRSPTLLRDWPTWHSRIPY